jgi:predicted DNA-binding protein (MmcQ/YjbR family)
MSQARLMRSFGSGEWKKVPYNAKLFCHIDKQAEVRHFSIGEYDDSVIICFVDFDYDTGGYPTALDSEFTVVDKNLLSVMAAMTGKVKGRVTLLRVLPVDAFKLLKTMLCKKHPERCNQRRGTRDILGAYHLRERGQWALIDSDYRLLHTIMIA